MKDLINDMELVERFLSGKLTDEEKKELAQRQDEEMNFNKLIQDMDRMVEGIKHEGQKTSIEEKIKKLKESSLSEENVEKEQDDEQTPGAKTISIFSRASMHVRYAVAAAVVLLVVSTVVIINNGNLVTQPDLYAEYFEPFDSPGSGLTRSGQTAITVKAQAYEAYDAENYSEAIKFFQQALAMKDEAIMDLCLANAFMQENEHQKAEERLLHMLSEHTDLVTQTKWYLALAYLKQEKLERARATLWEISDSSTYGDEAKKLLDDLD